MENTGKWGVHKRRHPFFAIFNPLPLVYKRTLLTNPLLPLAWGADVFYGRPQSKEGSGLEKLMSSFMYDT